MGKSNKIMIGLLIFIIVGAITILILNDKGVIQLCGSCKCEANCPKCENAKKDTELNVDVFNHYVLYSDDFKVELLSNGVLGVKKGSVSVAMAMDITSAEYVTYGMKDICNNAIIAMINKESKLSAYDVTIPYCGTSTELTSSDIKEVTKLNTLNKKVIRVYNERDYVSEFEPYDYHIFAQFEDGSVEDITNYFK